MLVVNSMVGFAEYSEESKPTLRASGADQGGGSEALISEYFGIKRSDEYTEARVASTLASRDYKSATDLVSIDLQQVTSKVNRTSVKDVAPPITPDSETVVFEAIDVRNMESNGDIGGTLQAKENGSYSLNYQNPIAFDWRASNTSERQRIVRSGDYTGTLQANKQDAITGAMGVRRLMPIETERLQSFPDGWTEFGADGKPISDSTRYRMMGNAVTISIVEWIFRRMIQTDRKHRGN